MAISEELIIFGATILRLVSRLISFSTTYLSSREISRQCSMLSTSRKTRAWRISSRTWLHIVEDRYHVKPIIYTYYKFKKQYLDTPVFDDYPYWIAHYYVDKIEYQGEWKFWQHTDAGKLPGIKGYVDFNIYNGSFYDLKRLCID